MTAAGMNLSKAFIFILVFIFACGFLCAPAGANDIFIADSQGNTLKHVNSGLVFPYTAGGFTAGNDVRAYDLSGNDVSVPYNLIRGNDYVAATVYVYAMPAAPGRNGGEILNEHFEGLKAEILNAYKGALVSEDKTSLKGMTGRMAVFKVELMGEISESELYLSSHKGWFIKYRISYPARSASFARPEVSKFVNSLNLIQGN